MSAALRRHDAIVRDAIEAHGGVVFKTVGDAFCAAFADPIAAVVAAVKAQRALGLETWSAFGADFGELRVRMALHAGVAECRDGDYYGPPVNRVARLLSAGHGGQVLVSFVAEELVRDELPGGATLRDLGEHELKDLGRPERIFQLMAPGLAADHPRLVTLDRRRTNLPIQTSSFIGRAAELAEVGQLLAARRLVTLTGVGGCGKTRLGLQVAAEMVDAFPDGVWFVDLAPLSEPRNVSSTVAHALGVAEEPGRPLEQALFDHLQPRRALLVLDNCEHLIGAAAELTHRLLATASGLVVLATSREALDVPGECTYTVSPLAIPRRASAGAVRPELHEIARCESVRLFVDRASAARPGFEVDASNAPAVAEICSRLDGIPLAIELAAVRVRAMPVADIAARLDHRFRLLTGGRRTALPRQQTLEAAIDWSHDLLTDEERDLFHWLAVFHGGWTLAACEAVCATEGLDRWQVSDLLGRLVEKSLVVADASVVPRYRMLETVRQYAAAKLEGDPRQGVLRDRHAEYFTSPARRPCSDPDSVGAKGRAAGALITSERDNLRAAMDWAASRPHLAAAALQLAVDGGWRWGGALEERTRLGRLLSAAGQAPALTRAEGYRILADLMYGDGDVERQLEAYEASIAAAQESGDVRQLSWAFNDLANCFANADRLAESVRAQETAIELKRQLGADADVAISLCNLGEVVFQLGEVDRALALFEESVVLHRRSADPSYGGAIQDPLFNLASLALRRGDRDGAAARFSEALAFLWEMGDRRMHAENAALTWHLSGLARVAGLTGAHSAAVRWLAAVSAWVTKEDRGYDLGRHPVAAGSDEDVVRSCCTDLEWSEAWAEGLQMTMGQAVEEALAMYPPPGASERGERSPGAD
jgi:predicted ATPase